MNKHQNRLLGGLVSVPLLAGVMLFTGTSVALTAPGAPGSPIASSGHNQHSYSVAQVADAVHLAAPSNVRGGERPAAANRDGTFSRHGKANVVIPASASDRVSMARSDGLTPLKVELSVDPSASSPASLAPDGSVVYATGDSVNRSIQATDDNPGGAKWFD